MVEVPRLLVTLPPFHDTLEALAEGHSLKNAFARLSQAYRQGESSAVLKERADYLAYAVARMPATYAVLETVLAEVAKRWPFKIKTFLDLGSGPGTAYWAAECESYRAVERDPSFIALAKELGVKGEWVQSSLEAYAFNPVDLTLFSYVVAEIKEYEALVMRAYQETSVLVIVEPGTPAGFERIRLLRRRLIAQGAHILAPCPSEGECPMQEGNWCHFSKRLSRSRLHRSIKGADLGYEDEKYSYVIAAKTSGNPCKARILTHPHVSKGKVLLPVCLGCELKTITLKKTKLKWGDALESLDSEPEEQDKKSDGKKTC